MVLVGHVFKKQYCARNFFSSTKFQEESWILVHFNTIQEFPEWYCNSGSALQSRLVLSRKKGQERRPLDLSMYVAIQNL